MTELKHPGSGWGDRQSPDQRRFSVVAVLAICMSVGAFLAGPLQYLVPVYNASLPETIASLLLLAGLVACLPGLAFSYAALIVCPLGGPARGRLLAWIALAAGYSSLLVWYACFAGTMSDAEPWVLYALAAIVCLHLAWFAAESTAGTYLLLTILIGGSILGMLGCYLVQSRSHARKTQCIENLGRLGWKIGIQYDRDRGKDTLPETLPGEVRTDKDRTVESDL